MKAKPIRGSGIGGLLKYALDPEKEARIVGGNLSGQSVGVLTKELSTLNRLRPDAVKPVWHCPISLPAGEKLTDEKWCEVTTAFMERMVGGEKAGDLAKMGWVAVIHNDKDHQHVHIIASRVQCDGELFLGEWERKKAITITQDLEKEFGLVQTPGMTQRPERARATAGEREAAKRGRQPETAKERIQAAVDGALAKPVDLAGFKAALAAQGIEVALNQSATTGRISGASFRLDGHAYKGSALGGSYTWSKLQERGLDLGDKDKEPKQRAVVPAEAPIQEVALAEVKREWGRWGLGMMVWADREAGYARLKEQGVVQSAPGDLVAAAEGYNAQLREARLAREAEEAAKQEAVARKEQADRGLPVLSMHGDGQGGFEKTFHVDGFSTWRREASTVYRRSVAGGFESFHDLGNKLEIAKPSASEGTLLAALKVADAKWDCPLQLDGAAEYKIMCAKIAGREGIAISNPELKQVWEGGRLEKAACESARKAIQERLAEARDYVFAGDRSAALKEVLEECQNAMEKWPWEKRFALSKEQAGEDYLKAGQVVKAEAAERRHEAERPPTEDEKKALRVRIGASSLDQLEAHAAALEGQAGTVAQWEKGEVTAAQAERQAAAQASKERLAQEAAAKAQRAESAARAAGEAVKSATPAVAKADKNEQEALARARRSRRNGWGERVTEAEAAHRRKDEECRGKFFGPSKALQGELQGALNELNAAKKGLEECLAEDSRNQAMADACCKAAADAGERQTKAEKAEKAAVMAAFMARREADAAQHEAGLGRPQLSEEQWEAIRGKNNTGKVDERLSRWRETEALLRQSGHPWDAQDAAAACKKVVNEMIERAVPWAKVAIQPAFFEADRVAVLALEAVRQAQEAHKSTLSEADRQKTNRLDEDWKTRLADYHGRREARPEQIGAIEQAFGRFGQAACNAKFQETLAEAGGDILQAMQQTQPLFGAEKARLAAQDETERRNARRIVRIEIGGQAAIEGPAVKALDELIERIIPEKDREALKGMVAGQDFDAAVAHVYGQSPSTTPAVKVDGVEVAVDAPELFPPTWEDHGQDRGRGR